MLRLVAASVSEWIGFTGDILNLHALTLAATFAICPLDAIEMNPTLRR